MSIPGRFRCTIIACLAFVQAHAENIVFPTSPDAGVINVKTAFAVVGDGVTDDTVVSRRRSMRTRGRLAASYIFPMAPTS